MENYNVNIEVTDKFTDDVSFCLETFRSLTPNALYDSSPGEWKRWFQKNPYGNGLYSIAKDGNKIIGFCSLIPVPMVIDKKIIKGAKAEFLFILPEYRKRTAVNIKHPVSVALLSQLYQKSGDYGFNLVFGVATKAASKAHLLAGKKPMELNILHYFTFFKPRDFKEFGNIKNTLFKYSSFTASAMLRKKLSLAKSTGFSILKNIDSIKNINPQITGKDELIYNDRKMLNFRFTPENSLVYEINNQNKDFLIFSKPYKNAKVFLRHWSSLSLSAEHFAPVFKDLFKKCKETGAGSLNISFSGTNNNPGINFSKFGFLSRKSKDILLLYKSNPDLKFSYDQDDWSFTDTYRGFI